MEKRDKLRIAYLLFGLLISAIGIWLCLKYFDYKLLLVWFFLQYGNNISKSDTFTDKNK